MDNASDLRRLCRVVECRAGSSSEHKSRSSGEALRLINACLARSFMTFLSVPHKFIAASSRWWKGKKGREMVFLTIVVVFFYQHPSCPRPINQRGDCLLWESSFEMSLWLDGRHLSPRRLFHVFRWKKSNQRSQGSMEESEVGLDGEINRLNESWEGL